MHFNLFVLVASALAAAAAPAGDNNASKNDDCSPQNGYIATFDFSACPNADNLVAMAEMHTEAGVQIYSGSGRAPSKVCIKDNKFAGYLYVQDKTNEEGGIPQAVFVNLDGVSSGSAYVASRPDDQMGKVGTKPPLPIVADLTLFKFSDTGADQYILTGKSTAASVLKSAIARPGLYVNYCSSKGKSDEEQKKDDMIKVSTIPVDKLKKGSNPP